MPMDLIFLNPQQTMKLVQTWHEAPKASMLTIAQVIGPQGASNLEE